MRWSPAGDPRSRPPVAVILAAGFGSIEVVTDDGELLAHHGVGTERDRAACDGILRSLPDGVTYSLPRLSSTILTTGADRWSGRRWRHTLSSVTLDAGPKVLPMRRPFEGVPSMEAAAGIFAGVDWLWSLGVGAGSVSSMASRLWRRSLARPIDLHYPEEAREAFYGGRQEAPLGPVGATGAVLWDLAAAYPTSMSGEPYARRILEVGPATRFDQGGMGFAQADVKIPPRRTGPLPIRVDPKTVCYVTDTGGQAVSGWWTWRELAMAAEVGCEVTCRRSFAPLGEVDLFGPWWQMVAPGRQLPGPASRLAKSVTSSLWGTFAMSDHRARHVRWADPEGKHQVMVKTTGTVRNRWAVAVAGETTGRVRQVLHDQALAVLPGVLHVDTDGVIAGPGTPPAGVGWSAKTRMELVEVRAPQTYRWQCSDCDLHAPWHYCVSGASTEGQAAQVFARTGRRHSAPAVSWSDTTLPPMSLGDLLTVAPVAETLVAS